MIPTPGDFGFGEAGGHRPTEPFTVLPCVRHTSTTSISRRRAASIILSRSCRCDAPEPVSLICMAIVHPRRAAYSG
jgi:hypothetical protein